MRTIAVLTTSYPGYPGDPSGHFVQTEARELARRARVIVLTTAPSSLVPPDEDDGVRVIRVEGGEAFGWPGVAARLRESPSRVLSLPRWLHRARAALRTLGHVDQVVAHWAIPCAFPLALGVSGELEIISHGGDVRLLTRLPFAARSAAVRCLLAKAVRWRFVSESLRQDLAGSLRSRERIKLLATSYVRPASVSFPDVKAQAAALRESLLLGGRDRLVVCVGRLVHGKGWGRALDHVAREAMAGKPARLVVIGDGPERARLEAQARALSIEARFLGKTTRGDALAWIGAADALLHSSRHEGLSTVVREAAALGTPVVFVS